VLTVVVWLSRETFRIAGGLLANLLQAANAGAKSPGKQIVLLRKSKATIKILLVKNKRIMCIIILLDGRIT
jgi:hypothetical protein